MQLRSYQLEALDKSKERYERGTSRQLLALPTGMGKTPTFAALREHYGFQKRVLVLVHREELAAQAADKIAVWNPSLRVGIEMGDNRATSDCDFVVGSVQTLGRANSPRLLALNPDDFDAVICDEAHHSVAQSYKTIFDHFGLLHDNSRKLLFGVTATPNRGDGQGLGQVYDEIVFQYPMLKAIQDGWLCEPLGLRVRTGVELDGIATRMGDFEQEGLSRAVNTPARNELLVREWLKHGEDRQTVAFTVDVAHAKALADAFKQCGVAAEAIWSDDPLRKDKLRAHRAGHLRVLSNCGILTEGYDDWRVGCIVLARPTKSQLLFVQMAGRGTRLPEGINNLNEARAQGIKPEKENFIVLDVTDNTSRHSLVTLASIFGLPPKTDLRKTKITDAVAKFEMVSMTHPNTDLSGLEDIRELESYVKKVNLFDIKFSTEVEQGSKLCWHKTPAGNYLLLLPDKEKVTITLDLLGHWNIQGSVRGNEFKDTQPDLFAAFTYADTMVEMFGKELLKFLRQKVAKSGWAKDPITPDQIRTLKWKLKGKPWPDFTKMNKNDGRLLITKLFAAEQAHQI